MKHKEITGVDAVHPFAYVQSTDPALDVNNGVAAGKSWVDTSGGSGAWTIKVRNAANSAWEPAGGGSASAYTMPALDDPPVSPNAMDDEFNDASFDAVKWTWNNQGTATVQEDHSSASLDHLVLHNNAASGDNYHMIYQPIPAGTWKFRTKMIAKFGTSAAFAQAGIFIRHSASGKFYCLGPLVTGSAGMYIQAMNGVSSYNSTAYSTSILDNLAYFYLEVEYDLTNYIFRWMRLNPPWAPFAFAQAQFVTALTVAPASFLTGVADQIGLCVDNNNAQPIDLYADWFRRVA